MKRRHIFYMNKIKKVVNLRKLAFAKIFKFQIQIRYTMYIAAAGISTFSFYFRKLFFSKIIKC